MWKEQSTSYQDPDRPTTTNDNNDEQTFNSIDNHHNYSIN